MSATLYSKSAKALYLKHRANLSQHLSQKHLHEQLTLPVECCAARRIQIEDKDLMGEVALMAQEAHQGWGQSPYAREWAQKQS